MQIQKEDIKVRILDKARMEFIEKGFQKASMRRIASKAGVSTSNVYNYFENKDRLFASVLEPVTSKILAHFQVIEQDRMFEDPKNWTYESHKNKITHIAKFIDDYRPELNLIAFKSFGSSFESFKDDLVEKYTFVSLEYISKAEEFYPDLKCSITEFCMHNIASLLFNIITEVLMHDIKGRQMEDFLQEMMIFVFFGYEGIMGYDFSDMKPKHIKR